MRKHFVLDTNVLLHDPGALAFADNSVVVPIYVIEEIDRFKRDLNELGRSAREVSRSLDELRKQGEISKGIDQPNGGSIQVYFTDRTIPVEVVQSNHAIDNRILAVAIDIAENNPDERVILVSKDINLRIRADVLGLEAVDYDSDRIEINELYTGMTEYDLDGPGVDDFYKTGFREIEDHPNELVPNEFVHIKNRDNPSHSALGKVSKDLQGIIPITRLKDGLWGIDRATKSSLCHRSIDG